MNLRKSVYFWTSLTNANQTWSFYLEEENQSGGERYQSWSCHGSSFPHQPIRSLSNQHITKKYHGRESVKLYEIFQEDDDVALDYHDDLDVEDEEIVRITVQIPSQAKDRANAYVADRVQA